MVVKKYYCDTNAIYSLINKFTQLNNRNVYISILNLQEILSKTFIEKYYIKRKPVINKISNLLFCDLLPEECIASAFGANISNNTFIIQRKKDFNFELSMLIQSTSFKDYKNNIEKYYNSSLENLYQNFIEKKETNRILLSKICLDIHKKYNNNINKHSQEIIGKNDCIKPSFDKFEINRYARSLLLSVFEGINVKCDEENMLQLYERYSGDLNSFLKALYIYTYSHSFYGNESEKNDIVDLFHLLYLRNCNDIIVSNDKLFENLLDNNKRITKEAFIHAV